MKFVKILNNYPIYQNNIIKINAALYSNKITQIQSKLFLYLEHHMIIYYQIHVL